ncbi:dioxygenase [Thalassolituus sp. ST750PaO-4]|uniref:DODA-type extradiol aromatic ring-opening family dioxygenase n=1 Tax=Thalassolituus sp. ST750PaO-4 TaxID=2742965 RepID=UPI001CE381D3|nr:class III extradiol ring-cleavage dioxygenase [Thalassolituus sp. ST750PaO-4]MCA6058987.1 dioxygenase [Thalassolituus sp. ST750PaO-4]
MSANQRQPSLYIPHGGGPCFFMEWPGNPQLWDNMAAMLRSIPARLPQPPSAILLISAHWEAPVFTFCGGSHPKLEYDYYGFPPHTYEIRYQASGAPALAERAAQLLQDAGIGAAVDNNALWDHGVFIPLKVAYPQEEIPVLAMSLKKGLNPAEHQAAGKVLAQLRDENVLIIGSGLSYHNLRAFFADSAADAAAAKAFDDWLIDAAAQDETQRTAALNHWSDAPGARQVHPREEHLLPMMMVAGAAGADQGSTFYREEIMGKAVSAIGFGLKA